MTLTFGIRGDKPKQDDDKSKTLRAQYQAHVQRMFELLGDKPEQAFFVRCDRTTMTQNDLDNGRMIVLIGVAPVKPAEFVIFRIGQWTADAQRS